MQLFITIHRRVRRAFSLGPWREKIGLIAILNFTLTWLKFPLIIYSTIM